MNEVMAPVTGKPAIAPRVGNYFMRAAIVPWLFVLPGLVFTLWLKYYPIARGLYMSFFEYDIVKPPGRFTGFGQYARLLQDPLYWDAWKNTFAYLLLTLAITFVIPIIQALFLNELGRLHRFFSTIYLVPAFISLSVNVMLWKWVWNPDYGLANVVTKVFGLGTFTWLSDPRLTKFSIVFPGIIGGGMTVLLYLAAIKGISEELYDAAAIDGCSGWSRMRHITLPNIRFLISIQLVLCVIGVMQILDGPFQFTNGGPHGVSTSMALFIYQAGNQYVLYGKASAASILLFLVVLAMSIFQVKMEKSEKF